MTRKNTLIASSFGSLLFLVFLFATELGICTATNYSCTDFFDPIAQEISIFFPLFLLSLITYKMRNEVYQSWSRLALWWVPLSVLVTLITPTTHDWIYPLASKAGVALISSALFLVVSLVLIVWKYLPAPYKGPEDKN